MRLTSQSQYTVLIGSKLFLQTLNSSKSLRVYEKAWFSLLLFFQCLQVRNLRDFFFCDLGIFMAVAISLNSVSAASHTL